MDILSRPHLVPDHCIAYGPDPCQVGHLWLPAGHGQSLFPLVIFFHGGWWKSKYDLGYAGYLCAALKEEGFACWSVEYRRVGGTGGGWPYTFQDAAAGMDFVTTLAKAYPLDLTRVITMGHSAGGHLAFWAAGRRQLERDSELQLQAPTVALMGAVALGGAVDLRLTIDLSGDGQFSHDRQEVEALMGGGPQEQPTRYKQGNPGDLLPFDVPQILIQGSEDDQIPPELPWRWAQKARAAGDSVSVVMIPSADHLDVVDPDSEAWPMVCECVRRLVDSASIRAIP